MTKNNILTITDCRGTRHEVAYGWGLHRVLQFVNTRGGEDPQAALDLFSGAWLRRDQDAIADMLHLDILNSTSATFDEIHRLTAR
jgi:hypothetical protein